MTTQDSRHDYEIARDELNALFGKQGFANPRVIKRGLLKDESGWEHNAFAIEIEGELISWKSGTGIKGQPNPAEVLANLCREGLDANEALGIGAPRLVMRRTHARRLPVIWNVNPPDSALARF